MSVYNNLLDNLAQDIKQHVQLEISKINTQILCEVQSYNKADNTVDVKILLGQNQPLANGVPIGSINVQNIKITITPKKGDFGKLEFYSRDNYDDGASRTTEAFPDDACYYLPVNTNEPPIKDDSKANEIIIDDGKVTVNFKKNEVKITTEAKMTIESKEDISISTEAKMTIESKEDISISTAQGKKISMTNGTCKFEMSDSINMNDGALEIKV